MVNNTKYGLSALQNNSSGINNTAIGAYAAFSNLDASNNTAIGSNSSYYTTNGSNNTSLGAGSLCNNSTGSLNTAIGSSALEGPSSVGSVGNKNTAIGVQSLYSNQGDQNTAIGAYSALGVTGGSYNTFLGTNTSILNNISYNYSTAIGYGAIIDDSNQIMMGGNASGSYPNVIIPGLANYTSYIPSSYEQDTLVPKQYVDQYVSGISIKGPVSAISLTNLSGTYSSTAPGSINGVTGPLIIDGVTIQDGSGVLLNGQTDPSHNGIYTWDLSTNVLTRREGLENGDDAVSAYTFVRNGDTYAKTAWVQVNNPAIVGDSSLNFVEFYNFDYKLSRGLDAVNTGGITYINVDTSLNFINFLDSNTSDPSANGTLALGTNTNNSIVIGPTGGIPIKAQSIIQAQKGITGSTGSFNNLYVTNKAQFVQDINVNTLTIGLGSSNVSTNTAVGNSALLNNTSGDGNTAVGISSLQSNTSGYDNTAVGKNVLLNNTTGYTNVSVGRDTMYQNTTGRENTVIGAGSLYNNTTGSQNTAIGKDSLNQSTTSDQNTALGYQSLQVLSSGIQNSVIGYRAAYGSTGGNYNTYIGANSGSSNNASYNYSTSIGYNSKVTSSNQIMLGGDNGSGLYPRVTVPGGITGSTGSFTYLNSSNNTYLATSNTTKVGIGTSSPQYTLDVSGNLRSQGRIYIGIDNPGGGSSDVAYMEYVPISGENTTLRINVQNDNNDNINLNPSGNVGIKKDSPQYTLDVSGNGNFSKDINVNTLTIGLGSSDVSSNTAVGNSALLNNTSGYNNTAIGFYSLQSNTSGYENTAIGKNVLLNNTSGVGNTAVGINSLQSNTSGSNNTAIGKGVLFNNTSGYNNVCAGRDVLFNNTTGNENTVIGTRSLYNNTTGSQNTAIGKDSLNQSTTSDQNTALGAGSLLNNTTGSQNTAIGYSTAFGITGGNYNTYIGANSGSSNYTSYDYSTAIGYNSKVTSSHQIMLGGDNNGIFPLVKVLGGLDVSGNGNFTGSVTASSFNTSSDYRIKENIEILNETHNVDNLRPVIYTNKLTEKRDMGLIAHEVQEIYPFLVNGRKDGEKYQSVNYTSLIALLIKEIKDLKCRVKVLEDK